MPNINFCVNGGEGTYFGAMILSFRVHFTLPLQFNCLAIFLFAKPLMWLSFFVAGAVFGLFAFRLVENGSPTRAALYGGVAFLVASFIGSNMVPGLPNPDLFPLPFSSAFGIPFAIMSFVIAFIVAITLGLVLRTHGLLWRALVAAAVTGICYWLVVWILHDHFVMLWTHDATTPPLVDSVPDAWRPMGPMIKTIIISNFIAGTIGGWATLALLTIPRRPTQRAVDSGDSLR
jgi:hypothetical protein